MKTLSDNVKSFNTTAAQMQKENRKQNFETMKLAKASKNSKMISKSSLQERPQFQWDPNKWDEWTHRTSSSRKCIAALFSRLRKFLLFSTDEASPSETKVQLAAPHRVASRNQPHFFPSLSNSPLPNKRRARESQAPSSVVCISISLLLLLLPLLPNRRYCCCCCRRRRLRSSRATPLECKGGAWGLNSGANSFTAVKTRLKTRE